MRYMYYTQMFLLALALVLLTLFIIWQHKLIGQCCSYLERNYTNLTGCNSLEGTGPSYGVLYDEDFCVDKVGNNDELNPRSPVAGLSKYVIAFLSYK